MTPQEWRLRFREGEVRQTAALSPGHVQANLAILPAAKADAFENFLRVNRAACPLLARGQAGDPALPELGEDIDVRTDLPLYRIFEHGQPSALAGDIRDRWRSDFVPFAIGCSLTFEADLVAAGVALRCFAPGVSCSAFDTSIPNRAVGPFAGNLVVSMRAIRREHVDLAVVVTEQHPTSHGAPVHIGDPARIGVDLSRPIDGLGLTDLREGEVPVFWACGVTMERAIALAGLPIGITHAPGHMLVSDLRARPGVAA